MGKHQEIAARLTGLPSQGGYHPCYLEYFRLFNERAYYEAHDILEHIWLGSEGQRYVFYKALIQFAGGFVHLQHHHREPEHRIHGRRLRPAARLFLRSAQLLEPFPQFHEGISTISLRQRAVGLAEEFAVGDFLINPWTPEEGVFLEGPRPSS